MKRVLRIEIFVCLCALIALSAWAADPEQDETEATLSPSGDQGGETLAQSDSAGASCASTSPVSVAQETQETLSDEEIERVADYMVEKILETGTARFEKAEIEEATGVSISEADGGMLRPIVAEKLGATDAGRGILSSSRCQDYGACSLYGDLSGATGDILAMYEREKGDDGQVFEDFRLPEFTASDLAGNEVRSADLAGQPVLLAFVAVHCRHSMDSLPILQELTETYGPEGLRVVAVAINSGEVQDVNTWFPTFDPKYEVWVSSGDALGDQIGSHLVPTYLLVDAEGRITEKLVGYKEPAAVTKRVLARLVNGQEPQQIAAR